MSDIQQARDVLAKWRELPGNSAWAVGIDGTLDLGERGLWGIYVGPEFSPLIVGTAGNPDLLGAIDKVLADADRTRPTTEWGDHGLRIAAERIATAIIAADERMSA